MTNSINVIYPYKHNGLWVFDDESKGLNKEALIAGTDLILDAMTADLKNPSEKFRLIFGAGEFPGWEEVFHWDRRGDGGNWYKNHKNDMEGWLCPALFKYFDEAPTQIYVRAENFNPFDFSW